MKKAPWAVIFLIFILPLNLWAAETSFYVNLQDFPLYLKMGFNSAGALDLQDPSWRKFTRWSHVIISKLKDEAGLPDHAGRPERAFLSPFGKPEQEWTIAIPFAVEGPPSAFPGLYLAAIGDNWEVYLNGKPVRREMHLDGSGRILEHHSERKVFFPIDRALFHEGDNLLVFRIIGDPTDQTIGFQYSAPYYLADYEYISRQNSETLEMILIGVFILVGIYHFLIFAIIRENRYNLFCSLFSLFMGLYYLSRTRGIYLLIPDTWIVVKLEFFLIFLVIPVLGAYTEILCLGQIGRVTKIYAGLFAFLALSQLFFVHSYGSDTLIVWQLLGIPALLWVLIHHILLPFVGEVKKRRKARAALWNSYPGNLFLGMSLFILCAVADIINALFLHYTMHIARYALCLFVLATAAMLARLYGRMNRELAAKSALLENAEPPVAAREALFKAHGLTEREKEVARLIVDGLSNTQIARQLFVSESSVGFHITNIYRKFAIDGKSNGRAVFLAAVLK